MEVKIIEQSGRGNEHLTRYASPLQLLESLREHAGKSNNLPGYESISRLIQLIKDESLDEDDVPVKQLLAEIESFQQGTLNENGFLIRILGYVEEYGARVKDLQPVFARYFRRSYKKHQEQAIRLNFELETLVINHERERRSEEAARRLDASKLLRAKRDYERKQKLAEKQRDLRLAQLAEE